MNTQNIRIQVNVSAEIAQILQKIAQEDVRTVPGVILNILKNTPAIQTALKEHSAVVMKQAPLAVAPPASRLEPRPVWPPTSVRRVKPELSPEEAAKYTPEQLAFYHSPENAKLQGWT